MLFRPTISKTNPHLRGTRLSQYIKLMCPVSLDGGGPPGGASVRSGGFALELDQMVAISKYRSTTLYQYQTFKVSKYRLTTGWFMFNAIPVCRG